MLINEVHNEIHCHGGVSLNFATLLYSRVAQPPAPFGDGRLCLAGPRRTSVRRLSTWGACRFRIPPIQPGTQMHVQVLYRERTGTGNTSNSITLWR